MFSRLTQFVNQAVEVVVPQAKTRAEVFKDHWQYIQNYYSDDRRGGIPASVDDTNISFHLEHLVRYIKEEELELNQMQESELDSSWTGPCLEILLQKRILETLVGWAEINVPDGMRLTVLKTSTLLISNMHYRLLPEGAVRLPLERLIFCCHSLNQESKYEETKLEMIRLVLAIFRQLEKNPALLNLFMSQSNSKTTEEKKKPEFFLFTLLYDYISSSQQQTKHLAKESILIGLQALTKLKDFKSIIESLRFDFVLVGKLKEQFLSLPTDLKEMPNQPIEGNNFFELWDFTNDLISFSKQFPVLDFENFILKEFIMDFIFEKLAVSDETSCWLLTEYFAFMIGSIKEESFLELIFDALFIHNEQQPELKHLMFKRAVSKSDQKSLSTWKLFLSFLYSYNQHVYEQLIFASLPTSEEFLLPQEQLIQLMEKILDFSSKVDQIGTPQGTPTKETNGSYSKSYDLYFMEAQEKNQICFEVFSAWHLPLQQPNETDLNFLDLLISEFGIFYQHSPKKNLILTHLVSHFAQIPHASLQQWLYQEFLPVLFQLHQQGMEQRLEIEDFAEKFQLIKKYAGDDILNMLHHLSFSSASVIEMEKNLIDHQTHRASPQPPATNDNQPQQPSFSKFLSAFLILSEFGKEYSAILMIVQQSLNTLKQLEDLRKSNH